MPIVKLHVSPHPCDSFQSIRALMRALDLLPAPGGLEARIAELDRTNALAAEALARAEEANRIAAGNKRVIALLTKTPLFDVSLPEAAKPFEFLMPVFVAGWNRPGDPGVGYRRWVSIGARPVWFFNHWASLAIEGGADHVDNHDQNVSGWLRKITIAPQLATGPEFFARLVIRAFVTFANWSPGLRGKVGGDSYLNRLNGLSAGLQFESWW